MARPVGTKKPWQDKKKSIKAKLDADKWAAELAPEARKIIKELMQSAKSSPVVRKGCAEIVLKRVDERYRELDGKADYITEEDRAKKLRDEQGARQVAEAKKLAEENDGKAPLICLDFVSDEKTGTK